MNKLIRFILFFLPISLCALQPVPAQVKDTAAVDSALLKQIEQQMQGGADQPPATVTRSGISSNPDIGLVADFRGTYINKGSRNVDAFLNESELSFQSVVDPYIRADFFLSLSRDPATREYGIEVEEGYLTTLALPKGLQLKAGKFKQALGRINPVHAHALPFVDLPNAYVNYFGEEGLNDEGASLSWLLPNRKFYQELVFEATAGDSEAPIFTRSTKNRLVYLGHLKNFFTLNDNATLELGLTGVSGPNASAAVTNMRAADLTYKWKPVQMNTYKSFTWQSEIFYNNEKAPGIADNNSMGLYSFMQDQVSKLWFLTGRFDYAQKPYDRSLTEKAYSLTAGWNASEFQKVEFEVKDTDDQVAGNYFQGFFRWVFIIGAHGAHKY